MKRRNIFKGVIGVLIGGSVIKSAPIYEMPPPQILASSLTDSFFIKEAARIQKSIITSMSRRSSFLDIISKES